MTPEASVHKVDTLVVLIAPAIVGSLSNPQLLHATLTSGPCRVRVLVSLTEEQDPVLTMTLATCGRPVEWLLAPDLAPPDTVATYLSMPPGSSAGDQDALALALSDVLIGLDVPGIAPPLLLDAKALGRQIIPPGDGLPCPSVIANSITHGLDPARNGWHSRLRFLNGRLEQALLELLAWNWPDPTAPSRSTNWESLRRCFRRSWGANPYYGPPLPPAYAACNGDATAPLIAHFEAFDRSALHGAFIHRDLIWLQNGFGAFAVLAALCGHLDVLSLGEVWGALELLILLAVFGFVALARWTSLQDRWTACRLGAEQLRIARICLPLAVVPSFLLRPDSASQDHNHGPKPAILTLAERAAAEVKRAVRDQGLPRLPTMSTVAADVECLKIMVADQHRYHRRNAHKLEHAEQRLRHITTGAFWVSVAAVAAHFRIDWDYFLLLTAGGPALVAALHGAGTRLGIVHRVALSVAVAKRLAGICTALDSLIADPPAGDAAWQALRALAQDAAAAMGGENEEWHGLVRREPDDFP